MISPENHIHYKTNPQNKITEISRKENGLKVSSIIRFNDNGGIIFYSIFSDQHEVSGIYVDSTLKKIICKSIVKQVILNSLMKLCLYTDATAKLKKSENININNFNGQEKRFQ